MSHAQTADQAINCATSLLVKRGEFVTPTTQYLVINDWCWAWRSVAGPTLEDQEVLAALEAAEVRLFNAIMTLL